MTTSSRNRLAALVVAILTAAFLLSSCAWLTVRTPLTKSEAIVLLAGNHQERGPAAAMLYREGYAPRIVLTNDGILSSWSAAHNRNLYQVEWAEEELVKLGVPRGAIVRLPYYGSGTIFDALAVRQYASRQPVQNMVLVTSDYHTRRARWTFKNVFAGSGTGILIYPARSFGVSGWGYAVEVLKLAYYRVKYVVPLFLPRLPDMTPGKGE